MKSEVDNPCLHAVITTFLLHSSGALRSRHHVVVDGMIKCIPHIQDASKARGSTVINVLVFESKVVISLFKLIESPEILNLRQEVRTLCERRDPFLSDIFQ
jgi:hypothetical protein